MNNLLTNRNDEVIKQNSADFYTMLVYSKFVLRLDRFRIDNYEKFTRTLERKNGFKFSFMSLYENKFKICTAALIMYKITSILAVPGVMLAYYLVKGKSGDDDYKKCGCYFCNGNLIKEEKIQRYDAYYKFVNRAFESIP